MALLSPEIAAATKTKLDAELTGPITVHFFTQEASLLVLPDRLAGQECLFCRETRQLLEEAAALSDKIALRTYDFKAQKSIADEFGVDKIPAIIVAAGSSLEKEGVPKAAAAAGASPAQMSGVRFYGIPSGYEYGSLIEALIDVSRGTTNLAETTRAALKTLERDVRIQVFVTPTCPYCSIAVRLAHRMAVESPRIRAEMVESTEFPHLAQKYAVFGVPKTVMNDTVTLDGAVTEEKFLEHVLKAAGAFPVPAPSPAPSPEAVPEAGPKEPGAQAPAPGDSPRRFRPLT